MPPACRFAAAVAAILAASGSLAAQGTAPQATADPQLSTAVARTAESPRAAATPAARPAAAPYATAAEPVSLAPTEQNARVGARALSPGGPAPVAPPRRDHMNQNVALMIVGGAVLVVGAMVGGTAGGIIMIGGGVVGIIGLYRYLQ